MLSIIGLIAGAANTPVAASIMSIELFGPKIAPYAAVACIISFLMTGHRSIYSSQLLGMIKSKSLSAEIGGEMGSMRTVTAKLEDLSKTVKKFLQLKKR